MTTHPRSFRRAALAAVLGALIVSALAPVPVGAASSVTIDARPLLGGRYLAGGWLAVAVTLANQGSPTQGHLSAESEAGAVRRHVELPAGARKLVTLYVQPGGFQRQLTIRYTEPNGTVEAAVEVRVLDTATDQVAIVGDGGGAIRTGVLGTPDSGAPDPILLAVADVPERPEPLAGISTLVWAADGEALSDGQRRSIERWVADGGQLVVIGGADWQARTAGLEHLLPLEDLAAIDGVDQAPLAAWAGSDEALPAGTISTGALRDGARALVTTDAGDPLAAWHAVGSGRVVLIGPDLAVEAFRTWSGAPLLWSRILESGSPFEELFGRFQDPLASAASMARALDTLPSLDLPPVELLLAIIVAYIALIGPISYLVLRRIDRRELAWVTAPLLVIIFSAASYGAGVTLRGTDVIVNQIAVLRSTPAGTHASVEAYAGIFSPDRGTYDVIVDADALVASMRTYEGLEDGALGGARLTADQGRPARLHDLAITVAGYEYVRADGVVPHRSPLGVSWSHGAGRLVGRVTNVGAEPLADVAFVGAGGGEMIGDLEPGASAEFVIDAADVNQSAASDQVYGFAGFGSADPDRRRIAARRAVIDALVGYGGWMPVDGGFTGAGGSASYLIGWRAGEGPVSVELDGVEARRFAEVVEVVAVRPGMKGEVTVGPSQMAVTAATDGGAFLVGHASAAMGGMPGASATFSIALPLEASGLAPASVEIVAGLDPSMMLEGGEFAGLWPSGYIVEVQDPRSGEWSMLGDLGDGSRFAIADPHDAMSPAGRIVVRVTATEPDPNFGDPSVFVSASVRGTIAP